MEGGVLDSVTCDGPKWRINLSSYQHCNAVETGACSHTS